LLKEHWRSIRKLLFAAYLCIVAFCFQVSIFIDAWLQGVGCEYDSRDKLLLSVVIIWGLALWNQNNWSIFRSRSNLEVMKPVISASFKASAVFLVYLYIIRHPVQYQLQTGIFLILSIVCLNLIQLSINIILQHYRKQGYSYQTVLVVGMGNKAKQFADKIHNNAHWGYKIAGFIDSCINDDQNSDLRLWSYRDIPGIGTIGDLPDIIKTQQVDWVIFALENDKLAQVKHAVVACQKMGTRVVVLADLFPAMYSKIKNDAVFGYPVLCFDTTPQKGVRLVIKEIFDRVVAVVGIVLISPILITATFAVKLFSKGSILFIQERLGLNGRKFKMYKFRTMVPEAEKLKSDLATQNEMDGPVFKIENDPRITPVGRLLRKTSIDELPQLFNVVKGDMSLVGPRPALLNEVKQYDPWQRRRLSIKPGITCLWQINGRNNINFEKWMELDLEYIDNWSLWLDTKILAKTLPAVLSRKGAK